jgi:hypothetical protein
MGEGGDLPWSRSFRAPAASRDPSFSRLGPAYTTQPPLLSKLVTKPRPACKTRGGRSLFGVPSRPKRLGLTRHPSRARVFLYLLPGPWWAAQAWAGAPVVLRLRCAPRYCCPRRGHHPSPPAPLMQRQKFLRQRRLAPARKERNGVDRASVFIVPASLPGASEFPDARPVCMDRRRGYPVFDPSAPLSVFVPYNTVPEHISP